MTHQLSQFRKKPVVIEAMQFTEETKNQVFNWITCNKVADWDEVGRPTLKIQTLEGDITASLGDWVIKGVVGEFYPCKPDIFAATYESAYKPSMCDALAALEDKVPTPSHPAGHLNGNDLWSRGQLLDAMAYAFGAGMAHEAIARQAALQEKDKTTNPTAVPEDVRRDAERLDWLSKQYVVVRIPMRWGTTACFTGFPDLEEESWDLRAAIDASMHPKKDTP